MKKIIRIIFSVTNALVLLSVLGYASIVSAQYGMPAPRCDRVIDPKEFYNRYIDTEKYRLLHRTFDRWQKLSDNYENDTVCINKDEKAVLIWVFKLPDYLSTRQITYNYQEFLIVNWDNSAYLAHEITPEELIVKVESRPEVVEFLTEYSGELAKSTRWNNYWIGSSSYGENTGEVYPLQINYSTDGYGSITVSEKGIDFADLNIHQNWENFPTVKIGLDLVKSALETSECKLDTSPEAVSRFSPVARKNEQEPEEFIYNSYKISCPNNEYHYSIVDIYPDDGRYTVWYENRVEILLGG